MHDDSLCEKNKLWLKTVHTFMYEGSCKYFNYVVNIVHDVAVNVFNDFYAIF